MKPNHHEAADLQISRRISKIWHPFKGSKEGFRQVGSVAKGGKVWSFRWKQFDGKMLRKLLDHQSLVMTVIGFASSFWGSFGANPERFD